MKISLLVIASEVLEGKVQDINTLNLSKFLKSQNKTLEQVITVSDRPDQILKALSSLKESDLVVISGGMGPTPDDLTKNTIAMFLGTELISTDNSKEVAKRNYKNRGYPFPENHPYQLIPEKSQALFNPEGYAPGLLFHHGHSNFISLPGVPREFKAMIEMHLPKLLDVENIELFDFIIRTKNIGEERILKKLDPTLWEKLSSFGKVASLPYLYGVDITVRLQTNSVEEMFQKKKALESFILGHPLKEYVWHIGEESLEECIITKAKNLNVRFGFAESCTGGLCSDKITNINGSSSVFYGSLICYNTDIKTGFLKVDPRLIEQFDVVSAPVATQMASGLRSLFPIDLAISLTGYAGPHAKEDEIPVGTVFIGVSSKLGDHTYHHHFVGDRKRLKEYFYQVALFQLLETLEKLALR